MGAVPPLSCNERRVSSDIRGEGGGVSLREMKHPPPEGAEASTRYTRESTDRNPNAAATSWATFWGVFPLILTV